MEEVSTSDNKNKLYLYHRVPADMQGTTLHPLNILKNTHPDLYLAKAEKYRDRQHVMQKFIPTLECVWNDVLHLSSVHPAELKKALIESGMKPRESKFYQIDPTLLDPKRTTVYLFKDKTEEGDMNPENFSNYDPEKLEVHSIIPQRTREYYKEMVKKGEHPMTFIGVPHILHKGSIDISNLPIITV